MAQSRQAEKESKYVLILQTSNYTNFNCFRFQFRNCADSSEPIRVSRFHYWASRSGCWRIRWQVEMRWILLMIGGLYKGFCRYSTFLYPNQDPYQDPYTGDFNADAIFYVSVSVKGRPICLFLPYFKQYLHNIVIIHLKLQHLLSKMWWQVIFIVYTCPICKDAMF